MRHDKRQYGSPGAGARERRGLALIELLVIIAIISLLASMFMPSLQTDSRHEGPPLTGSDKGRLIRDLFFMAQMDPNWHLSSLLDDNPLTWMIEVNGLVVDVRRAPRETQEEAFRSGLIPYIPADIK